MSGLTRRKHVIKEMMEDDYELPTELQQIVRVIKCRGNNLVEVEDATENGEKFLVSIPTKFRKTFWLKSGNYILVDPIKEGKKVKAELCKILRPDYIREYTKAGVWPEKFCEKQKQDLEPEPEQQNDSNSDDGCDEFVIRNPNRPSTFYNNESKEDTESDDSDDEFVVHNPNRPRSYNNDDESEEEEEEDSGADKNDSGGKEEK